MTPQGAGYYRAWDALGRMLTQGRSLSGHERNCCYLNTGSGRFADVSAASGLNHPDDSRGVALVDWDLDGDVDIWTSSRTAPRARFLNNEIESGHHYLAVRLVGTSSNRDAIGARVELVTSGGSAAKSIRTLRAGEGYLAQSSKWLHFGLGSEASIDRVVVHWPGGTAEPFGNLAANKRYTLVQGSGRGTLWHSPERPLPSKRGTEIAAVQPDRFRIVPHRRLPLPRLRYIDFDGSEVAVESTKGPVLLSLWATWCQPCLRELSELARHQPQLHKARLVTLAVNVDNVQGDPHEQRRKAKAMLDEIGAVDRGGVATLGMVESLDVVQRVLLSKHSPLPVPSSFLLDERGRLAVMYKGEVSVSQILEDVARIAQPGSDSRDAAVPFAGSWFVNPFEADLLAIPWKLLDISYAEEALDYVERHVPLERLAAAASSQLPESLTADRLAELYAAIGIQSAEQNGEVAHRALEAALLLNSGLLQARLALAELLELDGHTDQALVHYRKILEIRPGDPAIANNVAWILATRPDRLPGELQEAVRYAEQVCQKTRFRVPSALDTLAAAYAAAGQFEQAVQTAERAIELAASSNRQLADKIRRRLELYKNHQPYRESTKDTDEQGMHTDRGGSAK